MLIDKIIRFIRQNKLYSLGVKKVPLRLENYESKINHFINFLMPYFYYDKSLVTFVRNKKAPSDFHLIIDNVLRNAEKIPCGLLFSIYDFCFMYCFFDKLPALRSAALLSMERQLRDKLMKKDMCSDEAFKAYFLACIELGKVDKVKDVLELISSEDRKLSESLLKTLVFQSEKISNYFKLKSDFFDLSRSRSGVDKSYYNYISGKTVAIVGPADSDEFSGAEIDSFDVVVRLNVKNLESSDDSDYAKIYGSKTDVAYYSSLAKKTNFALLENTLSFAVVPEGMADSINYSNKILIRGRTHTPDFVNGSPNMIPIAIFDLLNFSPSYIKVFKCDFYSGKKIYRDNYFQGTSMTNIINLALHDQLSQLSFVKNVYNSGLIDADEACSKVLKMQPEEYFSILSNNFNG